MAYNIAMTTSHNASVAITKDDQLIQVIELERTSQLDKRKNVGFSDIPGSKFEMIQSIKDQFVEPIDTFDHLLLQDSEHRAGVIDVGAHHLLGKFNKVIKDNMHHVAHASSTFYQSNFERAIVVSIDGGGNDGVFNVYKMVRGETPYLIEACKSNLGHRYASFGNCMNSMQHKEAANYTRNELRWMGSLIYPGKIMGLAGFGNVRPHWVEHFKDYYRAETFKTQQIDKRPMRTGSSVLADATGVDVTGYVKYDGQFEMDIAATAQEAFEQMVFETLTPIMERYHDDWPICITGGCALNIIANSKIEQRFGVEVFVAPNSSDCGLAVGMLADLIRPSHAWDVTYAGVDIIDKDTFEFSDEWTDVDINNVADLIISGKIFGVMRGTSEHGPRALGNRSIICNPAIADMKDIINAKIKNREWYRPFAPVVRLQDVGKFFERDKESRWMNFGTLVKQEYRDVLPSITHVDGTARVQTVTREQNAFIYDILTLMDAKTGIGVILNTSLNVDGQPIASRIEHAMTVYNTTEMDGVIINDRMIMKSS